MPRQPRGRIVRAATVPLWKRDKLEMRAVDALLSVLEPKPRRRKRRAAPKRKPPGKAPR